MTEYQVTLTVDGREAAATMEANPATAKLKGLLAQGPIAITLSDYGGFEKVGSLPEPLPRDDKQTTTQAGDIMLYQGDQMVIFYGSNTWAYTPLGKIDGMSAAEIRSFLGNGSIRLEISLGNSNGVYSLGNDDAKSEAEYFDLSGRRVPPTARGLIVKSQDGKCEKVYNK